jgi:hypothetical protein
MKVTYNDNILTLPAGTQVEDARTALKAIYPEIANAEAVETDGNIEFFVRAGTKGAETLQVIYGDNSLSLPVDTATEDARTALKGIYPEIANATAVREGNVLTFTVQAGTKGN